MTWAVVICTGVHGSAQLCCIGRQMHDACRKMYFSGYAVDECQFCTYHLSGFFLFFYLFFIFTSVPYDSTDLSTPIIILYLLMGPRDERWFKKPNLSGMKLLLFLYYGIHHLPSDSPCATCLFIRYIGRFNPVLYILLCTRPLKGTFGTRPGIFT